MSDELNKAASTVRSSSKMLLTALAAWLVAAHQTIKSLAPAESVTPVVYESYPDVPQDDSPVDVDALRTELASTKKENSILRERVRNRDSWLWPLTYLAAVLLGSFVAMALQVHSLESRDPQIEYRDRLYSYTQTVYVTVTPTPNGTPTAAATVTPKDASSVTPTKATTSPTATSSKTQTKTYLDFPKSIVHYGMIYEFFGPVGLGSDCAYYMTADGFDSYMFCLQG